MVKTLNDLALSMDKVAANLKLEVSRCSKEVALIIHNNLTLVTPVDTSTALSNWDIFIGSYTNESHEAWVFGKRGSTKLASMGFANKEAELNLRDRKFGQTIFIVNSVDYIEELNNGSSRQEPAGFVERAILLGKQHISEFKINLG